MPYTSRDTGSFCSLSGHCAQTPLTSKDKTLQVPEPRTPNPKPQTQTQKSEINNPKPETRNPEP
jgi:hypothetical protein